MPGWIRLQAPVRLINVRWGDPAVVSLWLVLLLLLLLLFVS